MRHLYLITCFLLYTYAATAQIGSVETLPLHSTSNSDPISLTPVGDRLYFFASDVTHGYELWSVGEKDQPKRLTDIGPGNKDGVRANGIYSNNDKSRIGVVNNTLYFIGLDHSGSFPISALYQYNTISGLSVADSSILGAADMIGYNNKLYLLGHGDTTMGLYEHDRGTKTTKLLHRFTYSQHPTNEYMVRINDKLYYLGRESSGVAKHLFEYNLTNHTKKVIVDDTMPLGAPITYAYDIFSAGNKVGFIGYGSPDGVHICTYDGSAIQLVAMRPKRTLKQANDIYGNTPFYNNGIIYYQYDKPFLATDPKYTSALFGYNTNTYFHEPLADTLIDQAYINAPGKLLNPGHFTMYNARLFFSAEAPVIESSLCLYDFNKKAAYKIDLGGTNKKTKPHSLVVLNNNVLYFAAKTRNDLGYELVRYTENNVSVPTINPELTTTLYPNPTTGDATLELSLAQAQELSLQLTDVTGRIVYQVAAQQYEQGKNRISLPTLHFSSGVYICNILNQNGQVLQTHQLSKL